MMGVIMVENTYKNTSCHPYVLMSLHANTSDVITLINSPISLSILRFIRNTIRNMIDRNNFKAYCFSNFVVSLNEEVDIVKGEAPPS